jgi:MFS family permease
MLRHILSLSALFLSVGFMLFAGGINSLLLPLRGSYEGFSIYILGFLGSGWAFGYISGCILTPSMVMRAGHIRSFCVLTSMAAVAILLSLLLIYPVIWIFLRAISGFCFAGAAMIVESWINGEADNTNRGRLFGVYTLISLSATTLGQVTLSFGDITSFNYFVLAAILYLLALVPLGLTLSATPQPVHQVRLNLGALNRRAPLSTVSVFMIGLANGAFGTLGVIYAKKVGFSMAAAAIFCSIPILSGALMQIPVGFLSDRWDRRKTLLCIALFAVCIELIFTVLMPSSLWGNLALITLLGGALYTFYPVIVALANDHTDSGMHLQTSGEVLVIFSFGTMIGPVIAGGAMEQLGTHRLFLVMLLAHLSILSYVAFQLLTVAPKVAADKTDFIATPLARTVTPETFALIQEEADGIGRQSRTGGPHPLQHDDF